jgi:hypothetical protein
MNRLVCVWGMLLAAGCNTPAKIEILHDPKIACTDIIPSPCFTARMGAPRLFVAVGFDEEGKALEGFLPATWRTEHPELATVDAQGVVTAHQPGTTQLIATYGGLEVARPLPVLCAGAARVDVTPAGVTFWQGSSVQLAAKVLDGEGREIPCNPVEWLVHDPRIASITPQGLLTGLAQGHTRVSALPTQGGQPSEITITVRGQ